MPTPPVSKQIMLTPLNPKTRHLIAAISSATFSTTSDHSPIVTDVVSLLTHHRSKSRWSHLRSLLKDPLTPTHFSQITLQLKSKPHLTLTFFHFTLHNSLCPHNLHSLSTVVHVLSRARLKSRAVSVMKVAIVHNSPIKLFETLVKTYRECDSAPFVFDLLIKTCLLMKKIDESLEIVRLLRSRGISPQIGTCNMLINDVCKFEGCFVGYGVFKEVFGFVGSDRIRPNVHGSDELSMGSQKDGDLSVMGEFCSEMGRLGLVSSGGEFERSFRVKPNVHSFNALLMGFHKDGELGMVEEVWSEMGRFGCAGDRLSYSVLMEVFFEGGRVCEAEKLWEEMRMKGIEPDVVAYNTMIGGFCKIGEVEKAEVLFREMTLKGLEHTGVTFEHLIKGHCRAGDVDSAVLVYKDMCRKDFRLGASTFEVMIGELCEKKRVSEALNIMKVVRKDVGFCPSRKSYELLLKGLCEDVKMEEALKIQAEMVGKGFKPNSEIYSIFIQGYVKLGNEDMAAVLRKEMVDMQKQKEEY